MHHAIQRQLDVIPVAEDLVVVPVLELDHLFGLALPAIHQRAAAFFLVDIAPVIVLGGIGLVSAHHPVGERLAAKLDAAVVIAQLHFRAQDEVAVRLLANEERIVGHGDAFGMAHDHAVAHAPHARIAVPSVQVLAVKQRLKTILREGGGREGEQ